MGIRGLKNYKTKQPCVIPPLKIFLRHFYMQGAFRPSPSCAAHPGLRPGLKGLQSLPRLGLQKQLPKLLTFRFTLNPSKLPIHSLLVPKVQRQPFLKAHFIQQKIKQVQNKNTVLISVCWLHSSCNHNFLKTVFYVHQRTQLLSSFFVGIKCKCRLHINSIVSFVADKIYFQILALAFALCILCVKSYLPHVNRISAKPKLVVNQIFHKMGLFCLSEIQPCIP